MADFVKKKPQQEDDSDLPLMERIKRKVPNQGKNVDGPHYAMKSVVDDMDKSEKEAIMKGTRKRKAPTGEDPNYSGDKNL